nr:N-acetylmuramoyl-L-alanine amidase [Shimia biformata]
MSCPSPNFGQRRDGAAADHIILHYTAMDSAADALARLCDPAAEVSCHYLIDERGAVWQLVEESHRAWHAGAGEWCGIGDMNSRSIGIELANRGDHPFPEPQMRVLETLLGDLRQRHAIPPRNVIGHSDMAPGRKSDPGRRFDWRRLALSGHAVWPELNAVPDTDPNRLRDDLCAFGYPSVDDPDLLEAMRLRFRPWARGPLSPEDMATAAALAAL